MINKRVRNIIEALGKHKDEEAIKVLVDLGTNSEVDEVRELTSKALIRRNTHDSLEPMINQKGKGINDLSAHVAMCAINELLALKDKEEAMNILENTVDSDCSKDIQDTARSVKALMAFSS
ncbi:HEAT repeat domain-containing protein [bacterium]|nr:HEAT repeat domain-containing protein [bacterium]